MRGHEQQQAGPHNSDALVGFEGPGNRAEDGEVVSQDAQTDFAILSVIGSRSQGRTRVSFERAENGFDLPTLAIGPSWGIVAASTCDTVPALAGVCHRVAADRDPWLE